jgi:hypothetical protein
MCIFTVLCSGLEHNSFWSNSFIGFKSGLLVCPYSLTQYMVYSVVSSWGFQGCSFGTQSKSVLYVSAGRGSLVGLLRAGRSVIRIPVRVRFSGHIQTNTEAHTTSCKMDSGSFSWGWNGQVVKLTIHPLLAPGSGMDRDKTPYSLCVFLACKEINFTFTMYVFVCPAVQPVKTSSLNRNYYKFHCFTAHFTSLCVMVQLMHLYVIKH